MFRAANVFKCLQSVYDNNTLLEEYPNTLDGLIENTPMQSSMDGEDDDLAALMYPRLVGILYQLVQNNETLDETKQCQVKATLDEISDSGVDVGTNERRV